MALLRGSEFPKRSFSAGESGRALAACYAGADVFVFPSRTDISGSGVMIEALAAGIPVAAYPVPGPVRCLTAPKAAARPIFARYGRLHGALQLDQGTVPRTWPQLRSGSQHRPVSRRTEPESPLQRTARAARRLDLRRACCSLAGRNCLHRRSVGRSERGGPSYFSIPERNRGPAHSSMPHATASWLVDNTALSFEQIAEFCGLHILGGPGDGRRSRQLLEVYRARSGPLG